MKKATLPVDPTLRTKPQREKRARSWPSLGGPLPAARVSVVVGSKRKNTRGISGDVLAQIHYEAHTKETYYAVATLKDRRVVLLTFPESTKLWTADVSHDLQHLWWYGLTQRAREALTGVHA